MEKQVYGDDKERLTADKEAWLKEREVRKAAAAKAALQ
jgi:hypothetical protein